MSTPTSFDEFLSGLWKQNLIFVMVLGTPMKPAPKVFPVPI